MPRLFVWSCLMFRLKYNSEFLFIVLLYSAGGREPQWKLENPELCGRQFAFKKS